MKTYGKKDASITVSLCLAFTAIAVLLLTLAEGARYDGLKADAEDLTNLAAESLCAGYQPFLFVRYRMFFLDAGFGQGKWTMKHAEDELRDFFCENTSDGNRRDGIFLYGMHADAQVDGYLLATDGAGTVFAVQAAKTMKKTIGERAAKEIRNRIKQVQKTEQEAENPGEAIDHARKALEGLEEKTQTEDAGDEANLLGQAEPFHREETENPLEALKQLQQQGILTFVMPPGKTVSSKTISVDNCLMKRKCRSGNLKLKDSAGWYERILMQEFIKPLAGSAVSPEETGVLSYGTEYLICGKDSDVSNLKGTVNRLLLLREAVNYLYLQTDQAKQSESLAIAGAIGGALANPAVVAAIHQGILAAWAYVESISDVKGLLAGGKIPLIKSPDSWHTRLSAFSESLAGEYAGEARGFTYENYLDVLLYGKSLKQIAYRSMDLMEKNMQQEKQYAACRMDYMAAGVRIAAEYDAKPVFLGIFGEDRGIWYHFKEQSEYLYEH